MELSNHLYDNPREVKQASDFLKELGFSKNQLEKTPYSLVCHLAEVFRALANDELTFLDTIKRKTEIAHKRYGF